MKRIQLSTLLFLLAFLTPAFSVAQQPEPDAGEQVAGPEVTRFQTVEQMQDELEAMEEDRRATRGQERVLIADQIAQKRSELGNEIAELVDDLTADGATSDPAVMERARKLLARERRRISSDLEAADKSLADVSERQAKAESTDEKVEIESELARVNARIVTLLQQQLENLQLRKRLGANTTRDLEKFDERLGTRARRLSVLIEAARDQRKTVSDRPASTEDEKKARKHDLDLVNRRIDSAAESLRALIELMKERGLDTTTYQRLLIEATGQVTTDVFDKDVSIGLVESAAQRAEEWVAERAPHAAFALFLFALIILASWLVSRLVRKLVRRSIEKTEMSMLARDFAVRSSGRAVIAVGLLTGLSQLGIELGPVLAGLGIAGFVIGFALQDTLSNFASGLMILVYRPFDVGDLIEVSGVSGKVDQMTLVSTSILTLDNQLLIIPNNKIWNNVIRNVTAQDRRRVDFLFGIGYDDDIDKARELLREIVTNIEHVEADGEVIVELHELGDSSVNFVVRVWTQTDYYWDVFWAINAEVKRRFDAEGISIPFPQRDVHIHNAA